jgi:multidrug transporter EmrE-like cation transporter
MAAPMFIKSYALAPTIFQPWFLGTAAIAILGFVGSLIFFGEALTIVKILGAALALAGAVLLIL